MRRFTLLLLCAVVLILSHPSQATPITYTFAGMGATGTIGASTFTDAKFVFTLVGDTADVTADSNGLYSTVAAATFSIDDGINPILTGTTENVAALFEPGDFITLVDPTLYRGFGGFAYTPFPSGYALASDLAPVAFSRFYSEPLHTSLGDFSFSSTPQPTSLTFSSSVIPEPAFYQMAGLITLGGLGLLRLRRRR